MTVMTNPHRIDFHHGDVPIPTDLSGRRSPRRMITSKTIAQNQISDSFQIAAAGVSVGQMKETICRAINAPNSATKSPSHVIFGIRDAPTGW